MPGRKHTHQLQRRALGKKQDYIVYACVAGDCDYYVPEPLVVGKISICNRCKKNKFTIKRGRDGRVLHKPHCIDCTQEPRNPKLKRRTVVEQQIQQPRSGLDTSKVEDLVSNLLGLDGD